MTVRPRCSACGRLFAYKLPPGLSADFSWQLHATTGCSHCGYIQRVEVASFTPNPESVKW